MKLILACLGCTSLALSCGEASNVFTTGPMGGSTSAGNATSGGNATASGGQPSAGRGGAPATGGTIAAGTGGKASSGSSGAPAGGNANGAAPSTGGASASGGADAGAGNAEGGAAPIGGAGGASPCESEPPPMPTGKTIELTPSGSLADALSGAVAGDRIVLEAGDYAGEDIANQSFEDFVFVEAAQGAEVVFSGLRFQESDHVVLDGIRVEGTLELAGSADFLLRNVALDAGGSEEPALHLQGQGGGGANQRITVRDSTLAGGGRTVFVLGLFAPSAEWNHHLSFLNNQISCGSSACFQISGGRDLLIEGNQIESAGSNGILTAGATAVEVSRNRFHGDGGSALQIATPGAEWDNYAGVENMISSAILVANNVIDGFGTGVQFDAARDISIVHNTVAEGSGLRLNHRVPRDQEDNVILDGNSELKVWNNILPSITIAGEEERPEFESNNIVWQSGGGGTELIEDDPELDEAADFAPSPASPAVGNALANADTPLVDFSNHLRGDDPDIGAHELGATPACP